MRSTSVLQPLPSYNQGFFASTVVPPWALSNKRGRYFPHMLAKQSQGKSSNPSKLTIKPKIELAAFMSFRNDFKTHRVSLQKKARMDNKNTFLLIKFY